MEKLFKIMMIFFGIMLTACVWTLIATALIRGNFHPALIIFLLIGVFSIFIVRQSFKELKGNDDDDNL